MTRLKNKQAYTFRISTERGDNELAALLLAVDSGHLFCFLIKKKGVAYIRIHLYISVCVVLVVIMASPDRASQKKSIVMISR